MKTFTAKNETVQRDWYVVDAAGKTLGRLAAELAHRLRGSAATLGADLLAHCCSQLESGQVDPHGPQAWVTRAHGAFEAFAQLSGPATQAKG